jgi:hypothetical protein
MSKEKSTQGYYIDPYLIKDMIQNMDRDVAVRFVFSGVSLKPERVREAFQIACEEMTLRDKEKKRSLKSGLPNNLVDDLQDLFVKAGYDVKFLDKIESTDKKKTAKNVKKPKKE